jgi:hypothetical protein
MPESEKRPDRSHAAVRQAWVERLQRFAECGLSVVAFCRNEGVSAHSFYYWKHKLDPQAKEPAADQPRLLRVRLLDVVAVELVLPGGSVLRLTPGCDLDFVRCLVAALREQPC